MSFYPFSCFLEFMPEEESLKSRENKDYQPSTVLLDEVEASKLYEIVFTNFYGMPFLRYRVGDMIKIADLQDEETGIKLPQMVFQYRADDLIDIGGFVRLDEKTLWQAIFDTGMRHEEWAARKEYDRDHPIAHIYLEPKDNIDGREAEQLIHQQLKDMDSDYRDVEDMLGKRPLKVTILPAGSFRRYYEERRKAGADLSHLKPPHMNAPEGDIQELTYLTRGQQEG